MYSLVLWVNANPVTTSVLKSSEIKIKNSTTLAKWGKKWHNAKEIVRSNDKEYLDSLDVDISGNIMTPERRKSFPNAIITMRKKEAKKKKEIKAHTSKANMNLDEVIVTSHSIFSDDSDENDPMTNTKTKEQDTTNKIDKKQQLSDKESLNEKNIKKRHDNLKEKEKESNDIEKGIFNLIDEEKDRVDEDDIENKNEEINSEISDESDNENDKNNKGEKSEEKNQENECISKKGMVRIKV